MATQRPVPSGTDLGAARPGATEAAKGTESLSVPALRIEDLEKRFKRENGTLVRAVDGVTIGVQQGEFLVLLGPSGCGKTTLLRCIAGLETGNAGRIEILGRPVYDGASGLDRPSERRGINMIFQSYALWPHMTTFENVAFPLKSRGVRKADIKERVHTVLHLVGIGDLGGQYPGQLSGGQQQRVALARALVTGDELVLFDEPLSNVDAKVRSQLRIELMAMQRKIGFAAIYVTHDQIEAMELAHRIAVMREGRIEQVGTPQEIYEEPSSHYVADFIGEANGLTGVVADQGVGGYVIETDFGQIVAGAAAAEFDVGSDVVAVWRPEACVTSTDEPDNLENRWKGTVEAAMYVGTHAEHVLRFDETRFRAWRPRGLLMEMGSEAWLGVAAADVRAVPRYRDDVDQ